MPLNEFRQDLVSGEWVLFASGRGKRPNAKVRQILYQSPADCPFENFFDPGKNDNEVVWGYPDNENWKALIIKNKYPTLKTGLCTPENAVGPYKAHDAVGEHEVVVYRAHDRSFDDFTKEDIVNAVKVYKKRYIELSKLSDCVRYISIFHNHGLEAGATVYHPHSQIISMPILPPDVFRSLSGSFYYYSKNQRRVYDVILEWEMNEGKRIITENDKFVAFCPFASKYPFEVRIFSKESHAHFEEMPDDIDPYFADIIHDVLARIKAVLGRPAFNFFIHTAPVRMPQNELFGIDMHQFYHWHLEVVPHTKTDAGFEIGTGIAVNSGDPDQAAKELREANV